MTRRDDDRTKSKTDGKDTGTHDALHATMRSVASAIDKSLRDAVPDRQIGFGLFVFELAANGAVFSMSNASRDDMRRALHDWLTKEGT